VIVKVALPVLLCASVALQVTVVAPSGKLAPDAGLQVADSAPSMLSTADTPVQVAVAPVEPVASTVVGPGTVTTGAVVSTSVTVTVKLALPVFPCASVAEQVTVVEPIAKDDPEAWSQLTATAPSMLSVAEAEKVTATGPSVVVVAVTAEPGTVTTGGVVSMSVTWTVKLLLPVLP
jgi:hypothetical protein